MAIILVVYLQTHRLWLARTVPPGTWVDASPHHMLTLRRQCRTVQCKAQKPGTQGLGSGDATSAGVLHVYLAYIYKKRGMEESEMHIKKGLEYLRTPHDDDFRDGEFRDGDFRALARMWSSSSGAIKYHSHRLQVILTLERELSRLEIELSIEAGDIFYLDSQRVYLQTLS